MNLAIIILNYNGQEFIPECLESLRQLKTGTHSVHTLIVDNASTDNSPSLITRQFSEVTLIRNHQNLGFAAGNNVGINWALSKNFDTVMLLNNDTKVHPNLITELVAANTPLASPKIYFYPGFEFHHDRYRNRDRGKVIWYAGGSIDWNNVLGVHRGVDEVDHGQYDNSQNIEFATGCCLLIRREVFDKIGRFDSRYFLYFEDLDFCIRASRAQFAIRYTPSAILWHKNALSSQSGGQLHQYYFTRNRLLFGFHYAPWKTKQALLRESLKKLFTGTPSEKQGIADFYFRKFGKK